MVGDASWLPSVLVAALHGVEEYTKPSERYGIEDRSRYDLDRRRRGTLCDHSVGDRQGPLDDLGGRIPQRKTVAENFQGFLINIPGFIHDGESTGSQKIGGGEGGGGGGEKRAAPGAFCHGPCYWRQAADT